MACWKTEKHPSHIVPLNNLYFFLYKFHTHLWIKTLPEELETLKMKKITLVGRIKKSEDYEISRNKQLLLLLSHCAQRCQSRQFPDLLAPRQPDNNLTICTPYILISLICTIGSINSFPRWTGHISRRPPPNPSLRPSHFLVDVQLSEGVCGTIVRRCKMAGCF